MRWQRGFDTGKLAEVLELVLSEEEARDMAEGYGFAEALPPKPPPSGGVAAITGKWPGDETDEEIERALRELS